MRQLLLHNWREKLACLLLGGALWYLIRQQLAQAPAHPPYRGGKSEAVRPSAPLPKPVKTQSI